MSSQVKCKAAATEEHGTAALEVESWGKRRETVLEARTVLLRTHKSARCLLPLDAMEGHCSGACPALPGNGLPSVPSIICNSHPDSLPWVSPLQPFLWQKP